MNQREFGEPQSTKTVHEFVLCEAVKPNGKADIERLERPGFLFTLVPHVNHPIHTGTDQMKTAFVYPLRPVAVLVGHVVFHFLLLPFVDPRHARDGHQISTFGDDNGEHVPLLSTWITHQEMGMCSWVFLRLGLKALFREPSLEQVDGLIRRHVAFQFLIPFQCTLYGVSSEIKVSSRDFS